MSKRPNFLVILADDLGFSDIGCFGSEIFTPNIDAIAKEGACMTDFHATAACSPTRSILLTGTDNHIAGVGCMSEQRAAGGERWNVKGHEGYLSEDVVTLPELLQEGGYHTLMSGKWHLGFKPECNPAARGFDRSLVLLPGASNHYAWEPQFGPDKLGFFAKIPPLYTRDGKKEEIAANRSGSSNGFYTSDYYADNLVGYLRDWNRDIKEEKPFFAYLPFTAPHWPLQCSKADRDAYAGIYDDGPDALRKKRLEALTKIGIHPEGVEPYEVVVPHDYNEWDEMTPEEKKKSARSMETYAGMVTAMDRAIGRVIDYLRDAGEYDNTFVIFMSDNGACSAAHEVMPVFGKDLMSILHKYYDNSLDNIGNPDSFVWYGPRWAAAATAPHRMYKLYSTEGGLRVCSVLRYPKINKKLQSGALLRAFTTVADITPTILEYADIKHPASSAQTKGKWKGREVAGVRGMSWVKYLNDGEDGMAKVHTDDDPAYGWELFGRAALRKGKWKILHVGPAAGGRADGKWQLYDMDTDPGEVHDLAEKNPKVMQDLLGEWEAYVKQTGTVWGPDAPPLQTEHFQSTLDKTPNATKTLVGGDVMEQMRAWMSIGKGEKVH